MPGDYQDQFVTAPDGLRLHVRAYGVSPSERLPVVCLPGLTRNAADFDVLARALADHPGRSRQVFAIDYRGRGESEYDRDPRNYSLPVELADLLAVLTALEIGRAVFIGTSRGGILTMLMAAARPGAIAGAVLNDIGPVIEPKGLLRIKGYVGNMPQPRNFEEAAEILRRLFDAQFPKLEADDWSAFARRVFREQNGRLVPCYDSKLAETLEAVRPERALPSLWKEFDALADVPLLVIRGANSDVLSSSTVAAMQARRSHMEMLEVSDQGHAPLLMESDVIAHIAEFVASCSHPDAVH